MLVQAASAFGIHFRASLQLSPADIALRNCVIAAVGCRGSIQ